MSDSRSRPNVVFVLTDDQGYGDLSCLGNPVLRTPWMDRLHAQSVSGTDFHVAPVCTATRGELMTRRDALCNGATFICMGRSLLRADLPTMADVFAANGYHTGRSLRGRRCRRPPAYRSATPNRHSQYRGAPRKLPSAWSLREALRRSGAGGTMRKGTGLPELTT